MAKEKIALCDYGLLIAPNVCRLLVELHDTNQSAYTVFSYSLFKWVGAGCPSDYVRYIPSGLDLMQQGYLERMFSEHLSRWRTYNAHRRAAGK